VIPEKILRRLGYKSSLVYLPLKPAKKEAKNVPATASPLPQSAEEFQAKIDERARTTRKPAEEPAVADAFPPVVESGEFINVREG
jgi:hypothetical protein